MTAAAILSSGSRGAVGELRAAAYLIEEGFAVFRAVSPASPFDLAAWRDDRGMLRVEVKHLTIHNKWGTPTFTWPTNEIWDVLLLVHPDGRVFEFVSGTDRCEVIDSIRKAYGLPRIVVRGGVIQDNG